MMTRLLFYTIPFSSLYGITLALGQFYAKSNHSMERSDILLYENHLSFVEILFTGPKFKGKEGYPIAD